MKQVLCVLQVWDGTKCAHLLQDFTVEASAIQGRSSLCPERSDLAVNILVFDNHAQIARQLKVRGFHSISGSYCVFNP